MENIFISTSSFGKYDKAPLERLMSLKYKIGLNPHGRELRENEIKELLNGVKGLIAGTEPITRDVINNAESLKVISRCGIGIDNVDIEAIKERGIKLYRTPEGPALAVAELTLGFILDSLRHISYLNKEIRSGGWEKKMGRLFTGKTVGIVGMGTIGKKLTTLLRPFNCKILARDHVTDMEFARENNINYVHLDELLKESDIVTLHLPLDNDTKGFFDRNLFLQMKDQAIFINTSRGKLVDEDGLYDVLSAGKISHACLDVYNNEPYTGKLNELDNVTLTCHIGSYAKEARIKMEEQAVENLLKGLG
ncbi:MAG: phosphoglycerate dehydrogenase [Lentimicrobiaceae bacterium]|nr:phosphoglycerate dehydrogenase [Lentimicrobiaceae bacterium]